jgi:hypothetical protein
MDRCGYRISVTDYTVEPKYLSAFLYFVEFIFQLPSENPVGVERPYFRVPLRGNPLSVAKSVFGFGVGRFFWKIIADIENTKTKVCEQYLCWRFPVVFRRKVEYPTVESWVGVTFNQHPSSLRSDNVVSLPERSLSSDHGRFSLPLYSLQSFYRNANPEGCESCQREIYAPRNLFVSSPHHRHGGSFDDTYGVLLTLAMLFGGVGFGCWGGCIWFDDGPRWEQWFLVVIAICLFLGGVLSGVIGCLPGSWHRCLCDDQQHSEQREQVHRGGEKVAQAQPQIVMGKNLDILTVTQGGAR